MLISRGEPAHHTALETPDIFRRLVDGIEDFAIYMLDGAGRVATWNPGAQRLKGYRPEEIIGRPYTTFFPPEAVAAGRPARLLAIAAREGRAEDEGWRVRKDGSRFWADAIMTALRDAGGAVIGFAKVTRDMTAQRQAQQALRESEERFRRIANSAPALMWVTRLDRVRDFVNHAYMEFLGTTDREYARLYDWRSGIHPEDAARVFERFVRIADREHPGRAGTGLGLYIARQLAERLGGRLELEWSEPGVGSRFGLWLPLS